MMKTLKLALFGIAVVLVVGSQAQLPNLDNVGDILQSLKDSGMMDKFEKDLKQMMFDQKPVESRDSDADSDSSSSESEPPVDVYEFIKAYVTEKKIKLNEKVIFGQNKPLAITKNDTLKSNWQNFTKTKLFSKYR